MCAGCLGRTLVVARRQARVIGQQWAERVCRGEHRAHEAWPTSKPRTLEIARALVTALARDSRLLDELAAACNEGAAEWWQRRPDQYRLVTAPDERARCCVLTNGERCARPSAFRITGADGALDDYTYVCTQHRAELESELRPGDVVTPVDPE